MESLVSYFNEQAFLFGAGLSIIIYASAFFVSMAVRGVFKMMD